MPGDNTSVLLTVAMEQELHRLFKTKCAAEQCQMSDIVRVLIQRWLEGEIETHG
jgi:hypothetical protein